MYVYNRILLLLLLLLLLLSISILPVYPVLHEVLQKCAAAIPLHSLYTRMWMQLLLVWFRIYVWKKSLTIVD